MLPTLAYEGIADAFAAADDVGPQKQPLIRAAQESFVTGRQQALWIVLLVMYIILAYVFAGGPQQRSTTAEMTLEALSVTHGSW